MEIGQNFNPHRMFHGSWIPDVLMKCKEITSTEKLYYARLCKYAGKKGIAYPSYEMMADEIGISRDQAINVAQSLIKKGFIVMEKQAGKRNRYTFCWHPLFEKAANEPLFLVFTDENNEELEGSKDATPGVELCHPRGRMDSTPGVEWIPPVANRISKENHKKEYSPESWPMILSSSLLEYILERKPDLKRPNLQSWAGHVDKMIRLDGRDAERVKEVIEWCQKDTFWQDNILSTEKLREQFDKLELKMNKEDKDGARSDNPFAQSGVEAYRRLKKAKDRETQNDSKSAVGLPGMEACSSATKG